MENQNRLDLTPVTELPSCSGVLFVLVGPAGAGKNTIMNGAIALVSGLRQMPTATTRPIRTSEQEGREHWFVSSEAFQDMIANQELIEYQEVDPGRFYGTPRRGIEAMLKDQRSLLIADIDVHGAEKLKLAFPDHVVLIWIQPPDLQTLEARLRQRGGMSEDEIQTRLQRAIRELPFAEQCAYRIVNADVQQATRELAAIIEQEARQHGC